MPTQPFQFTSPSGHRLSGRLEVPAAPARAWALFAHCFTCGKDNLAAVRVSRRLAAKGIGTLRFDFAGLGASEGDFAESSFGRDVRDLVAAAEAMTAAGITPRLLIGHSLGGAAVLAAAGELPSVRALAAIGTPYDVAHVLTHIGADVTASIESEGRATVSLGGRTFTIGRRLVEDLRRHDQEARIRSLGRPILLLHSPGDQIVPISNATSIHRAARHPKCFISLDGADHLLSDPRHASLAADLIVAWADHHLPESASEQATSHDAEASETGRGRFQLAIRAGAARFIADEPRSAGGLGSGATPFNLLSAALAACTTMTLRIYAANKGWDVTHIKAMVDHRKQAGTEPPDVFTRRIVIEGRLDDDQRARMLAAANRCPVHRTLKQGARIDDEGAAPALPELMPARVLLP